MVINEKHQQGHPLNINNARREEIYMCIKIRGRKRDYVDEAGLREIEGGIRAPPVALIPVRCRIDGADEIEKRRVHRAGPVQRGETSTGPARHRIHADRLIFEPRPDPLRGLLLGRRRIGEAKHLHRPRHRHEGLGHRIQIDIRCRAQRRIDW